MPTMLNAALGALTPERSGSGSALISATRQVGATIGVAVLGTVIATVYQNRLHLPGLPGPAPQRRRTAASPAAWRWRNSVACRCRATC